MNLKAFMTDHTAGLPNWGWAIIIGLGVTAGLVLPMFRKRAAPKRGQSTDMSGAPTAMGGPYSPEDMAEGGSPVEASSTNLMNPYPGLPVNMPMIGYPAYANPLYAQYLLASDFGLGMQYPWWHERFYGRHGWRHRHRHHDRHRRGEHRIERNTEYGGQYGRGMSTGSVGNVVASSVGSR